MADIKEYLGPLTGRHACIAVAATSHVAARWKMERGRQREQTSRLFSKHVSIPFQMMFDP